MEDPGKEMPLSKQKVEIETVARTEWIYLQIIMMDGRRQMKKFYEYTQE